MRCEKCRYNSCYCEGSSKRHKKPREVRDANPNFHAKIFIIVNNKCNCLSLVGVRRDEFA